MKALVLSLGVIFPTYSVAEGVAVSASTYGDDWPFSADEGVIRCEIISSGSAVLLETEQGTFALNGTALGQVEQTDSRGWLDTREFQARDENGFFLNGVTTVQELIKLGLENC